MPSAQPKQNFRRGKSGETTKDEKDKDVRTKNIINAKGAKKL